MTLQLTHIKQAGRIIPEQDRSWSCSKPSYHIVITKARDVLEALELGPDEAHALLLEPVVDLGQRQRRLQRERAEAVTNTENVIGLSVIIHLV